MLTQPPATLHGISGRYATALYTAAFKSSALPAVEAEVARIHTSICKDDRMRFFLESPILPRNTKRDGVAAIMKAGAYSPVTANFFALLADNSRLNQTQRICEDFAALMAAHRKELVVNVTSAKDLDTKAVARLRDILSKSSLISKGQTIIMNNKVLIPSFA